MNPVQDGDLIRDIRALVEAESPSTDPPALSRSAETVAKIGRERLGVEPEPILRDSAPGLRWRFGAGPARVLLLAHHDTVWPIGTLARRPFTADGGVLRGPGVFDMKAGLALGIHAVARLDPRARDGITLLVTGDEEIGSPVSREVIEAEARGAAAVLVLEAAAEGGALKVARKGVSLYRIEIAGRAAHAGLEPERGANAGVELAHVILAMAALGDSALGTSVTPTVAAAGTAANMVPAEARLDVDVRAWTLAEQERVDVAVRAMEPRTSGVEWALSGGPNRPPLEEDATRALFRRAQGVAVRLGLGELGAARVGGASDGNLTAGIGVPTLDGLGAVGGGAHADDEHVVAGELPGRIRLLEGLLADLLDQRRS